MYELAEHLGEPLSTVLSMTEREYTHWWVFFKAKQDRNDQTK